MMSTQYGLITNILERILFSNITFDRKLNNTLHNYKLQQQQNML